MRISQLQNLCWAGNGLVLLGVGFVVLQFVDTYRHRGEIPEAAWEDSGEGETISQRWPGPVTKFTHIWDTAVNGLVPKPVEVDLPKPPELSPEERFRNEIEYVSALLFLMTPHRSVAEVSYKSENRALRLGESLGEGKDKWMLMGLFHDPKIARKVLSFRHLDSGVQVRIEEPEGPKSDLTDNDLYRPEPLDPNGPVQAAVRRDAISVEAWPHHEHPQLDRWMVPPEEVLWWETFGEEEVLAKLATKDHVDAGGVSHGLKIMSEPGEGTPVQAGRGIVKGDVIKAINGVPVLSKADILRYLRNAGRGLDRYEVLVENSTGSERTVVYEIQRDSVRSRI